MTLDVKGTTTRSLAVAVEWAEKSKLAVAAVAALAALAAVAAAVAASVMAAEE